MSKRFKERALVLKSNDLRESDKILTLITDSMGKLRVLAKGARRSKKRFMGGLDIFDCGTVEFTSLPNKDELFFLHSFSDRDVFLGLREDFNKLILGSLCLELTASFAAEGDPDASKLFYPLRESLSLLDRSTNETMNYSACAHFVCALLEISGFAALPDIPNLSEHALHWLSEMRNQNEPFEPQPPQTAQRTLSCLLDTSEQVLGYRLKTRL